MFGKMLSMVLVLMVALGCAGVAEAAPTVETILYESRGAQVPAIVMLPAGMGDVKAPLVVMAHGHGGSKDENIGYGAIANALAEQGIATIRMDFPGCGDSAESFRLNALSNMKQDVLNAIAYATANYPVDPDKVGIFGYSMGGRIALELLAEQAYPFTAVALLAPAASTPQLMDVFGGQDNWTKLKATAEANGYADFTTMFGQEQQLSKQWFDDLEAVEDAAVAAADRYQGPSLVIYADDDTTVSPEVSKATAEALHSQVIDATGDGHSYGFYSDKTDVLNAVAYGAADFFATTLAQ